VLRATSSELNCLFAPLGPRCAPSGPSRENRDREHQPPSERTGRRGGEGHRHFDACPRRRQYHRRIPAIVSTKSLKPTATSIREEETLPYRKRRRQQQQRLPLDREPGASSSPTAPASLAATRAQQHSAILTVQFPLRSTLALQHLSA
jgi:hypothetical protein